MKTNNLKEKLKAREFVTAAHIHLQDESIAEIMGQIGYDFLWIDTEHTPADYREILRSIRCVQEQGTAAIVRVTMHDVNHLKKVLEMGPDGIVFPMISTERDLEEAFAPTLYPPEGSRGFGPIRAARYGLVSTEEYLKTANVDMVRLIQIETREGVENAEKFAQNPYLDGFIIGPCDLSGSYGELGNVMGDKVKNAILEVSAVAKRYGKSLGLALGATDTATLEHFFKLGINVFAVGADFNFIANGAAANLKQLQSVMKR